MTKKASEAHKRKLSDAERHKRFIDMAREVEASDNAADFDSAFERITRKDKLPET